MAAKKTMKGFISYARENRRSVDRLRNNLRALERRGEIRFFDDHQVEPGDEWEETTARALSESDVILICVSDHLLGSEFIYRTEMMVAFEKHDAGTARVIPVILNYCCWEDYEVGGRELSSLQAVPTGGRPIQGWRPVEKGYTDAASQIKKVVRGLRAKENAAGGRRRTGRA